MSRPLHTHCPSCHASYRVRIEAAGRRARCKSCHHDFLVPAPADLLDDTIIAWLMEGAEREEETVES